MKTLKLKCNHCGELENYCWKDLEVHTTLEDVEIDFYCRKCGSPDVGGQKEIETLLEDYPEHEPNEDIEYEKLEEDKNEKISS